MDDDDLTPWNPDHFGHVDFKPESDGQLTIFYEDAHEPPDPDDFPSLEAYKIAWAEWEQTQTLPQQEEKTMFNFTAPIDNEIAQLQAKLAELEAQKQLLASRESCASKILADVEKCVTEMQEAGIDQQSLFTWAESIFHLITGDALPREKYNELQDEFEKLAEAHTHLKDVIMDEWRTEINKIKIERDTALQQYTESQSAALRISENLKAVREEKEQLGEELEKLKSATSEPVDDSVIEGYKNTIIELTIANQNLSEELLELRGESPRIILKEPKPAEQSDAQPEQPEEDPRQNPEYLEAAKNQEIVSEFLRKLDRISKVDKLDWQKIKELPLNSETMRELRLQASSRSKTHKHLLEQMPVMCAKYIDETGDNSDLEWLPEHFVEKVESLINTEEKGADTLNRGETVIMKNPDSAYFEQQRTVLDVNGEWVNVKDADGLTDIWQVSDVELVA